MFSVDKSLLGDGQSWKCVRSGGEIPAVGVHGLTSVMSVRLPPHRTEGQRHREWGRIESQGRPPPIPPVPWPGL